MNTKQILENWPPALSNQELETLCEHAVDYALTNGTIMRTKPVTAFTAQHAPFSLFPTPYPRRNYEQALELQPLFNMLKHKVSQDTAFIESTFSELSKSDPSFTGRLFDIWQKVKSIPVPISFAIHRSDYMLDHSGNDLVLQQVEINSIAASFASLSNKVSQLHKYLASHDLFCNSSDPNALDITPESLPDNPSYTTLSFGMAEAWRLYGEKKSCILFIVQPQERNIFDQRWLEYDLFHRFQIPCKRLTLSEVNTKAHLNKSNGKLCVDSDLEVAVVYFRAGYGPGDYPTDAEWSARLLIEQSKSIKCPSIAYQLCGMKKVQQVLSQPGQVEKYMNPKDSALIRSCFTGLYPADDSELGKKAREMALAEPSRFVLKPQREGGGNNFYGEDVRRMLQTMPKSELSAHILMERIRPPLLKNTLVKEGKLSTMSVVSELGIYGVWISKADGKVVVNSSAGHLLRTKNKDSDEGGVAAGFSVIDSPLLY